MKKITVSYYGSDYDSTHDFLLIIGRKLGIDFEFICNGSIDKIYSYEKTISDIFIYDVFNISDNECSNIFKYILNNECILKSVVFACIEGNKFAEEYCMTNHNVPYMITYGKKKDFLMWYEIIRRSLL